MIKSDVPFDEVKGELFLDECRIARITDDLGVEHVFYKPDEEKCCDIPYSSIHYLKPNRLSTFDIGERIIIEEKVDGSNASFRFDEATGNLRVFGKKYELDEYYNLGGCYQFVHSLDLVKLRCYLGVRYTVYFEWLNQHTAEYRADAYKEGYVISVRDNRTGMLVSQGVAERLASRIGMKTAPLLYSGPFISWEHIFTFVGKSRLGAEIGEGIVVKAQGNGLDCKAESNQRMLKLVSPAYTEFRNVAGSTDFSGLLDNLSREHDVEKIVTVARVRKMIDLMVEDGLLSPERKNWGKNDTVLICKSIGRYLYKDCSKDEPEFIRDFGKDFGKLASIVGKNTVLKIFKHLVYDARNC